MNWRCRNWSLAFGLWLTGLVFFALPAPASEQTTAPAASRPANEFCPVMVGTRIDPDIWLDYQDRRIYFCHEVCRYRFERNPEKYLANLPPLPPSPGKKDRAPTTASGAIGSASPMINPSGESRALREGSATGTGFTERLLQYAGKFHPVVVHLPIGLLLSAFVAEALFLWTRAEWLSGAARFCVLFGAFAALAAASLGWVDAWFLNFHGESAQLLEIHRWLGTATAGLALVTAGLSELSRLRPQRIWRTSYRLGLLVTVGLVGLTGHFGGLLIYGPNYFHWG